MGMKSKNTRRFIAAVNSRTPEENARILGVPVETLRAAMEPASGKTMDDFVTRISVGDACAAYAAELGRPVETLTEVEQGHAIQRAVLAGINGVRRREFFRGLDDAEQARDAAYDRTLVVGTMDADALSVTMNAVAAAQDALATARAAVEHAVKLGAGETLRAIVGDAFKMIGGAVRKRIQVAGHIVDLTPGEDGMVDA